MPVLIASEDHEFAPMLILEDLSDFHWPPPWHSGQFKDVLEQIAKVHQLTADLPTHAELHSGKSANWSAVAEDRERLLCLGLVSETWLEHALPLLLEAEANCVTEGSAVMHFDIRSDKHLHS